MKETTNTSQETELIEVVAAKESNDKDEPKTVYGKINIEHKICPSGHIASELPKK